MLLDLRREAKEAHDLCDPGAGDALPAGDGRLAGRLAGRQQGLPLEGFAEELDHPRRPGLLGRLGLPPRRRDGPDHLVGGHPARQDADVAVLERPVRPQGDLNNGLLAEFDRTLEMVGGDMDITEPDLRHGLSGLTEGSSGTYSYSSHVADSNGLLQRS